ERLYGTKQKSMKWQPYLTLMAKRPNALKYTDFYEKMPEEWKNFPLSHPITYYQIMSLKFIHQHHLTKNLYF
ncbi:hypothetical protein, partial [Ureibacillus thermosphaericus]